MNRLTLVYNPRSGRADSARARRLTHLRSALDGAGFEVVTVSATDDLASPDFSRCLAASDALIVAGGDGTVHHLASAAIAADRPIYHFPLGTENLFARQAGHRADPEALIAALRAGRAARADVGRCNGRVFLLMVSVGFDAAVVQRVAAERTAAPKGGVRRVDYVRHALHEFRVHSPPQLSIEVDGRPLVSREQGMLFISNSPEYAARLNPCTHANMHDGLLDVLFLPCQSRSGVLAWATSIAMGMHLHAPEAHTARAHRVRVESAGAVSAVQWDGEAAPVNGPVLNIEAHVEPAALALIQPA